MTKENKILILGGSGFVGSAILKAFAEDSTGLQIFALENNSPVAGYPAVKKIKGSMFDASRIIREIKPDFVVHAARISGKNYRFLGRRKAAFLGNRANKKLCETVISHSVKLLYISGSLMYGLNPKGPVTEDAPLNPISYAIEYQKAERPFLKKHNHAPLMICRPGWIFGPDSWYKEFFTDIIQNEGYVPQYGNGENFMSIIHRDDLARLVKEYVLNAPYSNVYNLFSPVGLPHKEFVMKLSQMYKKDIKVISEDELIQKYGEVVCHALTCDIHMATKYPAIMDKFNFEFRSVEDLLAKT